MLRFLQNNLVVAYILTIIRIYLGWQWAVAGWEKITGSFDASGFLKGALTKASGEHPAVQPWWSTFLEQLALPHVEWFNVLVPWGEFLVGIGLILGVCTTFSVFVALLLNFSYMFSGTTSTNPQMILMEFILLAAAFNSSKIGLDRVLVPYARNVWEKVVFRKRSTVSVERT
ncbi:Crp/Fnr family transcriptional regulator [Virgibacillus phasianinus]|uniref:Crp/Fnr family transcriptional regulator n=1 Tax=Virgibacillus phasianinus TaxID=2017483 RepID=A0A220TYH7_9BACI|nr:DoxX family protein [Virgibacillus phasianinus]ASK60723.1 Crp/Fnr family transcriptional regulator [Virgibacillus phasianinus]